MTQITREMQHDAVMLGSCFWRGIGRETQTIKPSERLSLEPHVVSIVRSSTNIHFVSLKIITSLACNPITMSLVDVSPASYAHTPIDGP